MKKFTFRSCLLSIGVALSLSGVATASELVPDDIRVSPMLRSKWGQTTHNGLTNGTACFNALTPKQAHGGCVAIAFAQVLRYFQHPAAYDWLQMPLSTLSGVTESQIKALGGLIYDLGRTSGAAYSANATLISVPRICRSLCQNFAFSQAEVAVFGVGDLKYSEAILQRLVIPCCDYGRPVVLSIDEKGGNRHAVVVDGYGYADGKFCVHVNCGTYGKNDGWFFPPKFPIGNYEFTSIGEVAYNILPLENGSIVSGRVLKPDGTPCSGADLVLTDAKGATRSARSSETGVYAILVENAGACSIVAKFGDSMGRIDATCSANVSPGFEADGSNINYTDINRQQVGNGFGFDIRLVAPPADTGDGGDVIDEKDLIVPLPAIATKVGTASDEVTISISDAEEGAEIRYTLDGSETTAESTLYTAPFTVSLGDLLHVRARAWKTGLSPSDEASEVVLPELPQVASPVAAVVSTNGTSLSPKSGKYTFVGSVIVSLASATPDATIRYTLDGSEPTTASSVYADPLTISDGTVVTAKAWRHGWLASAPAVLTFVYNAKSLPAVGDDWQTPMVIRGVEGTRQSDKVYRYSLDSDEAWGNVRNDAGTLLGLNLLYETYGAIYQYHTAWFSWTAPASGEITFDLSCPTQITTLDWKYWRTGAVVYEGSERLSSKRLLQSKKTGEGLGLSDNYFTFEAVEGETYLIGALSVRALSKSVKDVLGNPVEYAYDDSTAVYNLSWAMEDPQYAAKDDGLVDISGAYVALSNYVCRFTGQSRRPPVSRVVCEGVVLKENTDYTCAYMDNVNVGTGTVMIAGCGRYKGAALSTFNIVRRNLSLSMVSTVADQVQTGQPVTPPVTVRLGDLVLEEGTDYDLSYSDNVNVGVAKITLVGKGGLTGTVVRSFRIVSGTVVLVGEKMTPMSLKALGVDIELTAKMSVKAEGLPKGLKLTGSAATGFYIEGVPTETLDADARVAYVRVTDENKVSKLYPLSLLHVVSTSESSDAVEPARAEAPESLTCGVMAEIPVSCGENCTVAASGLPSGLKLNKVGSAYAIQGVPTATGDFLVTLTAKKGKASALSTVALRIAALPAWAQGTFVGNLGEGSFTLTVAANGKLSAKAANGGATWTYSAAGYTAERTADDGSPVFTLAGTLASGKETLPFELCTTNWVCMLAEKTVTNAALFGTAENLDVAAYRSLWSDKALTAAVLPSVAGKYTHVTANGERLALAADAKGTVKTTGTLKDDRKLSVSTTLVLDETDNWLAFVCLPPDTKKNLPAFGRWLTLVPQHAEPTDYGACAYRDGAVSATVASPAGVGGNGTVTLSPAFGQADAGKAVTLTAKPDRNSVFVKWVLVDAATKAETDCGYAAKLSLVSTGGDQTVRAIFRSKSAVASPTIVFDAEAFAALRVGVAFDSQVSVVNPSGTGDDLVRPVKFTAVNLPAGLKLDATSGRISGVPTKESDKPLSVTATSTVDKGKSASATLCKAVAALPAWAQGTFVGNLGEGSFTLTVAANGKLSAKAANGGATWTYSAAGYTAERTADDGSPVFTLAGTLASGKETLPFELCTTNWVCTLEGKAVTNAALFGTAENLDVAAYRTLWSDATLAALLLPKPGTYAYETSAGDELSLTIDKKGGVKAAGTVGGSLKVSTSSTAFLDETGAVRAIIYQAPNARTKQPAYYADIEFYAEASK